MLCISQFQAYPSPPPSLEGIDIIEVRVLQTPHHGAAQVDKSPTQWNFLSIKSTGAYCSWQMPHPWNCQVVKSPTYAREDGGWGMGDGGWGMGE